jgi:hypothetical protein
MKPLLPEFAQCGELFHTPSGTAFADIPLKNTGKPSPYAANGGEPRSSHTASSG